MRKSGFALVLLFCALSGLSQQQLSLQQCEQYLIQNNLQLLAQHYNIDAASAAVIQAKIWDQPFLSGEINVINPAQNRYFDVGASGQKAVAIQQLIYLGGKKSREVEFARSNQALAELDYEELVRSLRLELGNRFYDLYFDKQLESNLQRQVSNIDTLLAAYRSQEQRGNIALKDVVRLQSFSLELISELARVRDEMLEAEKTLKLITGFTEEIIPVAPDNFLQVYEKPLLLTSNDLTQKALDKNPVYLRSGKLVENSELYYRWQKSLSVPDLTLGASYDQRGGAFQNQVNMTVGMSLPFWNKNKGMIRLSEVQINQSKTLEKQTALQLQLEIEETFKSFVYYRAQYQQTASSQQSFEDVYHGVLANFQKRNMSLIEFTDFMESYNQSITYLNSVRKQILMKAQLLNYYAAETLF